LRHLEFTKQKLTTHLCFVFIGIEQDYSLNAADGVVLFDESKKKQSVNCVDLLMQLIKLARDSQIFTFTNPHLQNKITKVIKSKGELCSNQN